MQNAIEHSKAFKIQEIMKSNHCIRMLTHRDQPNQLRPTNPMKHDLSKWWLFSATST